ncbi:hypothetical protein T06_6169 [Trichinella sp. T6]|nr:hypothetical protein T06_6169 [Trichinella sp. T6]
MHAAGWSVSDDLCVQRETNKKAQTVKANWANPTAGLSISDSCQAGPKILKSTRTTGYFYSVSQSVFQLSVSSVVTILLVLKNLRTSNKRDGVESLTARQTWPNISGFQIGRRFRSFLEFEQAFDAWKSEHFHTFRVASSETLRLKDGAIDPIFKYRYIVYHCAHYGVPRVRGMSQNRKYNYLPCGCTAMLRLNYSWSERTLRISTLHEKHTGHAVSAQAYKEFIEKSKRFGPRRNPANETRCFSAPLPSTALTNCHTLEALLNRNDSPLSDKENDPAAVKSAAGDSVVIEDGVEANEEKVEPSSSPRTDEERFQIIHVVLQSLCDDLLKTEDAGLDEKLAQLAALHSQWKTTNL